jgi:hypothetical protein
VPEIQTEQENEDLNETEIAGLGDVEEEDNKEDEDEEEDDDVDGEDDDEFKKRKSRAKESVPLTNEGMAKNTNGYVVV